MQNHEICCDIVIIGGGIAGLWLLEILRQNGYNALLLECDSLGSKQSGKAQGIIHGGLKYALSGALNSESASLGDVPSYWNECLSGTGEVDLRAVKVLAPHQYMWSTSALSGGLATMFASNALRSAVQTVDRAVWPQALVGSAVRSNVYQINETIISVPSLLQVLANKNIASCIKIDSAKSCKLIYDTQHNITRVEVLIDHKPVTFKAQAYVATAGANNDKFSEPENKVSMQLRPLHMVLAKSKDLPALFGHCIGLGSIPRLTVTSHQAADGNMVWYLGGKLAEDGIHLSAEQQIKAAQTELHKIFPQLNFSNSKFSTFMIDRAEARQTDGRKPNDATIMVEQNKFTAWPTKLALAPRLAHKILQELRAAGVKPKAAMNVQLQLPQPTVATPIWDQI